MHLLKLLTVEVQRVLITVVLLPVTEVPLVEATGEHHQCQAVVVTGAIVAGRGATGVVETIVTDQTIHLEVMVAMGEVVAWEEAVEAMEAVKTVMVTKAEVVDMEAVAVILEATAEEEEAAAAVVLEEAAVVAAEDLEVAEAVEAEAMEEVMAIEEVILEDTAEDKKKSFPIIKFMPLDCQLT